MCVRVLFELRNGLLFFAILGIFTQNILRFYAYLLKNILRFYAYLPKNILRFYAYLPKNILRFQRNAAFANKLERNKLLRRRNNLFSKHVKTLRF